MNFMNFASLPEAVKQIINTEDYVGYVRIYHSDGHYGSKLFYKDAANGTVEQIKKAEEREKKRYTIELSNALKTVCETLFEENNPKGRYKLYDFCENNHFDKSTNGYMGYCYMAHSAFQIVVSKDDDYFCRVYFYER